MATVVEVKDALKILSKRTGRFGSNGSRIHDDSQQVTIAQIDALHYLCGSCTRLVVKTHEHGRGTSVSLRCKAQKDPCSIYIDRIQVSQVTCDEFRPRD